MEHSSERPRRITRKEVLRLGMLGVVGGILIGCTQINSRTEVGVAQESHEVSREVNLLEKQWSYLPGAQQEGGGLRIQSYDFAIVEQDGSGGQENPPVNLFGTRLAVKGDFALQAHMRELQGKTASLQFYGEVPVIADEFRIERKSVRATIENDELAVSVWDGSRQTPVIKQEFGFLSSQDELVLRMERHKNALAFMVNDQKVGEVDERKVFSGGQLWFGANSTGGSWLLSGLQAYELGDGEMQFIDSSTLKVEREPDTLQTLASKKRSDFTIGAAMALAPAVADAEYAGTAFSGNFGSLTTENALKWQFVHPKPGVYDFHEADALVTLAERHDLAVHGHALVFGEANPRWVQTLPMTTDADKRQIEEVMTDHIRTIMSHYKGRIASWDVINEPRNHLWNRAMGEAYITKALAAAHVADPDAILCINDYGLETDDDRWDAFFALMNRLKPRLEALGVPIDTMCVGFQSHVYGPADRIDPSVLRQHMRALGELGFKVRVSEMDVYGTAGANVQARQYADAFKVCFEEENCIGWTGWILSDRYNYYKDGNVIKRGVDGLFGVDMQPRKAMQAIRKVLER